MTMAIKIIGLRADGEDWCSASIRRDEQLVGYNYGHCI
jgi:hypothetical protein